MVHLLERVVVTNKGRPLLKNTSLQYHGTFVLRYCSTLQVAGRGPFQQALWTPSTSHHGPPGEKRCFGVNVCI